MAEHSVKKCCSGSCTDACCLAQRQRSNSAASSPLPLFFLLALDSQILCVASVHIFLYIPLQAPQGGGAQPFAAMRGQVLAGLVYRCPIASLRLLVGSNASLRQHAANAAVALRVGRAEQPANTSHTLSRQLHGGLWVCRASGAAAAEEMTLNSIKRREQELQARIGDAVKVGDSSIIAVAVVHVPDLLPPPLPPAWPLPDVMLPSCWMLLQRPRQAQPLLLLAGSRPAGSEAASGRAGAGSCCRGLVGAARQGRRSAAGGQPGRGASPPPGGSATMLLPAGRRARVCGACVPHLCGLAFRHCVPAPSRALLCRPPAAACIRRSTACAARGCKAALRSAALRCQQPCSLQPDGHRRSARRRCRR